jgi:hypothetical protein
MAVSVDFERGTDQVLERVGDAHATEAVDTTFEVLYRERYRDVYRYALLMLRPRPSHPESSPRRPWP